MTRWVVFFDDEPGMLDVRREREPLHLAYLERHADEIRMAGGLREAPGEAFVGGLVGAGGGFAGARGGTDSRTTPTTCPACAATAC